MKQSELEAIVRSTVRKIYNMYPNVEWGDLESQAWLIVTEQIDKWDPSKGASLHTFLFHMIFRHLQVYVQRYVLKELNMNGTRSHVDYAEEVYGHSEEDRIEAKLTVDKMLSESSGVSRDILELMAQGYSQSEVAERLSCSRQNVAEVLQKVRRKYSDCA